MLAALGAAALAATIGRTAPRPLPLGDAFLLLEPYLGLPPAERDRFYLAYRAVRKKAPAPDAAASIVHAKGAKTPLALDAGGFVATLPTLEQLKSKATFQFEGAPFEFGLELRASMAPAASVDIAQLGLALAQANAAIVAFAGGDASAVGKLTDAYFPDAGGGRAVVAGRPDAPLPVFDAPGLGQIPYFEAPKFPRAGTLTFARPPSRILLAGPPKKG